MNMKTLVYIFVVAFCSLFISGCEEDKGAAYPKPSEFTVSPLSVSAIAAGSTVELTINGGNLGWYVETSDDWYSVSRKYGSGDMKITLTIKANNSGSQRTGLLEIRPTFDQDPVRISINQD